MSRFFLSVAYYKLNDIKEEENQITVSFDNFFNLILKEEDNRLVIIPEWRENLELKEKYNTFIINISANRDESIYGCGEQFSYLNLRGRKVPLWTQEPGIGKNHSIYKYLADLVMGAGGEWWTTYFPQPTFISSDNYYVHIQSYAFAEFDFKNPKKHILQVADIPQQIVIDVTNSAVENLSSLTDYLGRQRPLPEWALDGVWLGIIGGLHSENPNSIPAKIERAKKANTKIAAIWAEDWTGLKEFKAQTRLYWNWKYDPVLYKDLPNYIENLHKEGIRFLGYNNCFLMLDGDLFEYARDNGYLVNDSSGDIYKLKMFSFSAALLDLTHPGCWDWFKNIIKEHMIGIGLDGWMCDFAEYLPIDAVVHSGEDPFLHHNEYPVLWAKLNAEAVEEMGRDKGENAVVFFNRSGNIGTTQYSPLIWAGDQVMTFWMDMGLPAAICAGISMGFVGVGQFHADIAGEFGILWLKRNKELFMRGTEFCTFTAVMRTHAAKDHSGWTYDTDEETALHFAKFSRIKALLKDYIKKSIEEYENTGLPLMRHPYLHYEDDSTFHQQKPRLLQYQYLLGRDLFVAPVYKKGEVKRKLYLPKDEWVHVWSEKEYNGGWIIVDSPLGEPPLFYRKNTEFIETFRKIKEI